MDGTYTHRIIVNEFGQVQVTRLTTKTLIHSSEHFNSISKSRVVYCESLSDDLAVETGVKLAKEERKNKKFDTAFISIGKEEAASHLLSFSIAAYFLIGIFFILLLIVR
jgi:hypothetical protein